MTQYDERVQRQRDKIAAEEWGKGIKSLHAHSLSSMWYDDRPQDTENGKSVLDVQFNDGTIRRTLSKEDGEGTYIFGKALTGQALLDAYYKFN
tara:strand:+ start:446 stop:724 length:279 start_codon:yes stop_codon:yes gene_type:complete